MNLTKSVKRKLREFLIDYYPKILIDREWLHQYGHRIDWENPRNINEKIQWLICYSDTTKWSELSDKYLVRNFIKEKGFNNILTNLYGVWEDPSYIDFESLPEKFVLKCNHDSASTRIINKSQGYDKNALIYFYKNRLKQKFGYKCCEPHYNRIRPLVIAEEYLEEDNGFSSINDYKFWCFDGKVYYVSVMFDRANETVRETVYDINWNAHPEFIESSKHYKSDERLLPQPVRFKEMIHIASTLSKGFPEVRVDLYEVNGKIYFGEMTFTSTAGRMGYVDSFLEELGKYCLIDK